MGEYLVSIIMPTYNSEKYIEETIESIVKQTYTNWELLICDDCSTDSTQQIIGKMKNEDDRIQFQKLKMNSGAAMARNQSLKKAKGRYIAFIDSDDLWNKNKLMRQIRFMEENSYSITATEYNKIDENSNNLNQIITVKKEYDLYTLLKDNVGNLTVIYDSFDIGKPDIPNIRKRNDYLYWLTILNSTDELKIYGLQDILGSHRVHSNSLSSSKLGLVKYHWIVYREHLSMNIFTSLYLSFYWMSKGIIKLIKSKLL